MLGLPEIEGCADTIGSVPLGRYAGRLTRVVGLTIECKGLSSRMGELCRVQRAGTEDLLCEVSGFRDDVTLLMPLGEAFGLESGARVLPIGRDLGVPCGEFLLGRVLDALGRPMDGGPALPGGKQMPVVRPAPNPLDRTPITDAMPTGISVIDSFMTLGRGQRIGIFSGSGVGKSTLLSDIAKEASADVNVIGLIGERGREVLHFIEETLSSKARQRSVVVVATSDMPPLLRFKAAFTTIAIAEYFRDAGRDVIMMIDSVTRIAGAMREIGLALGEPPTVKGYPPSFFSTMPRIVERLGRTKSGSITGILTVLVDNDDMNEVVADTLRGLLDGHIELSRPIAHRGMFPAVNVLRSTSRVMKDVVSREHVAAASELRSILGAFEEARDLVAVGAYKAGSDPKVDRALGSIHEVEKFLLQPTGEGRDYEQSIARLMELARASQRPRGPLPPPGA